MSVLYFQRAGLTGFGRRAAGVWRDCRPCISSLTYTLWVCFGSDTLASENELRNTGGERPSHPAAQRHRYHHTHRNMRIHRAKTSHTHMCPLTSTERKYWQHFKVKVSWNRHSWIFLIKCFLIILKTQDLYFFYNFSEKHDGNLSKCLHTTTTIRTAASAVHVLHFWSRLKHLSNCWIDCFIILHLWSFSVWFSAVETWNMNPQHCQLSMTIKFTGHVTAFIISSTQTWSCWWAPSLTSNPF